MVKGSKAIYGYLSFDITFFFIIPLFRKLNNQKTGVLQSQDNGFTVQRKRLKRVEVVGVLLIHVSCFTAFTKMR